MRSLNVTDHLLSRARLSHKVYSAQQYQQYEATAAEAAGLTLWDLMQRAAKAVFNHIRVNYPAAQHIGVLAGKGNNGGDAIQVAVLAHQAGFRVSLHCPEQADTPSDSYANAWRNWQSCQRPTCQLADLAYCDVLVDGWLGTGIRGALRASDVALVEQVNSWSCKVVSIDVPSGLQADRTSPTPVAIKASSVVSLIAQKLANHSGAATNQRDHVTCDALDLENTFAECASAPLAYCYGYTDLPLLPARALAAHKGDQGKLLCIGSEPSMPGAIRLAAQAALRGGAGYVKAMCAEEHHQGLSNMAPELLFAQHDASEDQFSWCNCLLIGPGLGQSPWAKRRYKLAIDRDVPKVIDADGLNLLAKHPHHVGSDAIITPHPGEAARLLDWAIKDVEVDRLKAIQALHAKYQCTVVLKGSGTLVSNGQVTFVCTDGNPGMASAGMGDTLTGILGALLAQGLDAMSSALYGVACHAYTADQLALHRGQRGILATDIIQHMQAVINHANSGDY